MKIDKNRTYCDFSTQEIKLLPQLNIMKIKEFKTLSISGGWLNFYWALTFII